MAKMTPTEAKALYEKANAAGMEAFEACRPIPMIVGEAKSLFSSEIDYNKPTEFVADGVCGFAWVHITPARGPFVAYCKANKLGHAGYPKGYDVTPKGKAGFTQSMQRKEAWARAFAKVLREAGIDAYAESRMD